MATWNMHIVANTPPEDITTIASDVAKVVADAGHEVVSVVVTDDAGPVNVTPPPVPVEEPPGSAVPEESPADVPTDSPPESPVASGETAV